MRRLVFNPIVIILFMASCLAEQNNPLVIGSCQDGIQNQNEEDIDCGGICAQCPEPIVVPCEATLSDNVILITGGNLTLSATDYSCTEESGSFTIFIWKGITQIEIIIRETELPRTGMIYPIKSYAEAWLGDATVELTDDYFYKANAGELYLTFEDDQWVVELCSVNLYRNSGQKVISGRILGDW